MQGHCYVSELGWGYYNLNYYPLGLFDGAVRLCYVVATDLGEKLGEGGGYAIQVEDDVMGVGVGLVQTKVQIQETNYLSHTAGLGLG